MNLNAQRSGELSGRNPWVVLRRSKEPFWFRFNLIGRWAIVTILFAVAGAALLSQQ